MLSECTHCGICSGPLSQGDVVSKRWNRWRWCFGTEVPWAYATLRCKRTNVSPKMMVLSSGTLSQSSLNWAIFPLFATASQPIASDVSLVWPLQVYHTEHPLLLTACWPWCRALCGSSATEKLLKIYYEMDQEREREKYGRTIRGCIYHCSESLVADCCWLYQAVLF